MRNTRDQEGVFVHFEKRKKKVGVEMNYIPK